MSQKYFKFLYKIIKCLPTKGEINKSSTHKCKSSKCSLGFTRISCLILTEGESAKAFVLAGLEATNNKKWRVHSLQGKFLNVRDATVQQIAQNEEVQALDEGPQIGTR
ncbi:18967_t:CDS:2 [Entrophospora sp. SA101]|nr:15331_t:CDS:2 [Entrophospora sp. SA101]CAJ0745952.1 18967_t:CDS:2 [Entrophospora sp. SA101]CAJ0840780.1 17958_t:CDS:2 [Entrophospora sp. SA101]